MAFPGPLGRSAAGIDRTRASDSIGRVTPRLQATLKQLPDKPGVYLLKDDAGRVLYVGKAQSLRNRVRQYWQAGAARRPRCASNRRSTGSPTSSTTLTDTVSEALLLEANLIKRYQPRFNVRLKDDKRYPFIKVTLGGRLPAHRAHAQAAGRRQPLLRAVRLGQQRGRGDEPHPAAVPVPHLHHRDPRRASGRSTRPCLLYHIKRCQGPCIEAIDQAGVPRATSTR